MFKRTWNSPHFLARTASHSTKGKRNGRVDVLPKDATEALYSIADQIADGDTRLDHLRKRHAEVCDQLRLLERLDKARALHNSRPITENPKIGALRGEVTRMNAEMASIRRHVGRLKALIGSKPHTTLPEAFMALAEAELASDTFQALADKAAALVSRTRARAR